MKMSLKPEYVTPDGKGRRRLCLWMDVEILEEVREEIERSGVSASHYFTKLFRDNLKKQEMELLLIANVRERLERELVARAVEVSAEHMAEVVGKLDKKHPGKPQG